MFSRFIQLLLFSIFVKVINAQYEPQSNIDRIAQRPLLRPCPREWEWPCNNGECIAHYDVCDGIPQCTDGSDEWGCNENTNRNVKAHEGNAKEPPVIASTVASISSTTVAANSLKGTVTIQYSHILIALCAFVILSFLIITVIKRRSRKKSSGFRNRRGNILQQDSDEDDILISSMYS